jgi:hypothetical protein
MSTPSLVFIDTCVFEGQQYNFQSIALSSFAAAGKARNIRLLVPASINQEIIRHIKAKAEDAALVVDDARRKAPLLGKWRLWPKIPKGASIAEELFESVRKDYRNFLEALAAEHIGYENVILSRVMQWYDRIEPPFSEGKKRKEFPDAFALDSLVSYVHGSEAYIAIISTDQDVMKFCDKYSSLMYFDSLASYTEHLLSDDQRMEVVKSTIGGQIELVRDSFVTECDGIAFTCSDHNIHDVRGSVEEVEIYGFRVVAIGGMEATVMFDLELSYSAHLRWSEYEYCGRDEPPDVHTFSNDVHGSVCVEGTSKLRLSKDCSKITGAVFTEVGVESINVESDL